MAAIDPVSLAQQVMGVDDLAAPLLAGHGATGMKTVEESFADTREARVTRWCPLLAISPPLTNPGGFILGRIMPIRCETQDTTHRNTDTTHTTID